MRVPSAAPLEEECLSPDPSYKWQFQVSMGLSTLATPSSLTNLVLNQHLHLFVVRLKQQLLQVFRRHGKEVQERRFSR